MKLLLLNEVLPDRDAQIILRAAREHVPKCEAQWDSMFESIELQNWLDPKVAYVQKGDEVPIYITERNAIAGDAGYHDWDSINKVPYAYVSPKNSHFTFGKIHYPIIVKAHMVGLLFIKQRIFGKLAIQSQGLITAALHEIFELIADPELNRGSGNYKNTTKDSKGRSWMIENCDPIARNFTRWTDPVTLIDCVIPDFLGPDFYTLGKPGAFTMGRGGYAWEVKQNGTKSKIL